LATGYVARREAGRLRDQGSHLEHPNYRTALTRRRAELMLMGFIYMDRALNTDIHKTTIAAFEEAAMVIVVP